MISIKASEPDGQLLIELAEKIAAFSNPQVHFDLTNQPPEQNEETLFRLKFHMQKLMEEIQNNRKRLEN